MTLTDGQRRKLSIEMVLLAEGSGWSVQSSSCGRLEMVCGPIHVLMRRRMGVVDHLTGQVVQRAHVGRLVVMVMEIVVRVHRRSNNITKSCAHVQVVTALTMAVLSVRVCGGRRSRSRSSSRRGGSGGRAAHRRNDELGRNCSSGLA